MNPEAVLSSSHKSVATVILSAVFLSLAGSAGAAVFTWDGGGADDSFFTPANWAGNAAPPNNGTADIVFAGTTRLTPNLTSNPDWNLHSLTFANGAGAFNFQFEIFDLSRPVFSWKLNLGAGGITNNDNSTQTISLKGNVDDSLASKLWLTADQTWNAAAGPIVMNAPMQMDLNTVALNGAFAKTFSAPIEGAGYLNLNQGTANFTYANQPWLGELTVNTGTTVNLQAWNATGSGFMNFNGGTVQSLVPGRMDNRITLGAGVTDTFAGSNSLDIEGYVRTSAGSSTLNIANSSASGVSINGGLQVVAGSVLARTGSGILSLGDNFSPAGTVNSINGTLNVNSGENQMNTPMTLGSTGVVNINGGFTTFDASADLTVNEGGTFNLNAGTFSLTSGSQGHTLTVNGGTFDANASVSFGSGTAVSVQNSGQASFTGNFTTPSNFGLNVSGHGSLFSTTGDLLIQSGNTASVTVDGDLSAGGRLVVSNGGSGTLLLDGAGSKLTIGGAGPNASVIGSGNTGRLMMSDGAAATIGNALIVGNSPGGSKGEINLFTGSRLTVNNDLSIGTSTTAGTIGSVDIDGLGSKVTVAGAGSVLTIGAASGSTATVTVGDGTSLVASTAAGGGTVLNNTGTLNINGGTVELGPLTRTPLSHLNFVSGSLSYGGDLTVTNFALLGGSNTFDATRTLKLTGLTTIVPESALIVAGGSLTTGSLLSHGQLIVTSGTATLTSGPLTVISYDNIGPAYATVSAGATLNLNSAGAIVGNVGTFTVNGGTLDAGGAPLTANAEGQFVYQNNALVKNGVLGGAGNHYISTGGARLEGGSLAAGGTVSQTGATTLTDFNIAGSFTSGFPLTLAGQTGITGALNLYANGSVANGPVTVNNGGLVKLFSGNLTANAPLTAGTGGTIDIGAGTTVTANGGVVVNGGTLTRAATGVFNPSAFTLTGGGHAIFQGGLDYNVPHTSTISGAGTQLDVPGGQLLVDAGGTMNILGGAHVLVEGRIVASNVQTGAILVDGPGTQVTVQGIAAPVSVIGSQATGSLTVSNGAAITVGNENYIGNSPVTSNGTVSVQSGGTYTSAADVRLAAFTTAGTVGIIDVTGAGSSFNITGPASNLLAGAASGSTATVNVGPGGTFNASQEAGGGVTLNATATLNVNGGTANLGPLTMNGGHINLNSGTLTYAGSLTLGPTGTLGSNVTLSAGRNLAITGGTSVPAGQTLTISGGSLATAGVTVTGSAGLTGGALSADFLTVNAGGLFNVSGAGALDIPFGDILNGGAMTFNGSTFNASLNSLNAQPGGTFTYEGGARVFGGFLKGQGTHTIGSASGGAAGNARFTGTTLLNGATLQQPNTARLTNFTGSGTIHNGANLVWDGGTLTSSGVLNVNSTTTLSNFESHGLITVAGTGKITASASDLVLGAGSRTNILPGGNITALAGTDIELNGGLLVNNGIITGPLHVNFGSLAKGAGTFGTIDVTDGGRFSPGNSPGTAMVTTMVFSPGGRYDFELNSASMPGSGADFLDITGNLDIAAGVTANSRFTLGVISLDAAGHSAPLSDFDPALPWQFHLATADGGVTGFDPGEFALDLSGFRNAYSGTFSLAADPNNLYLNYTPVPEPGTAALLLLGSLAVMRRRR